MNNLFKCCCSWISISLLYSYIILVIQVGKHLKQIWTVAFRAMDDIKETVRLAGDKLCRSITSLTLRLCDVQLTEKSDASKTMDIVLPYLLTEGILSKVDSVSKASIGVVMKLVKVSDQSKGFCGQFRDYLSLC